ncbi:MAG: hypothetical protein ACREUL_18560 [Steroidobacteraceae bacterium]
MSAGVIVVIAPDVPVVSLANALAEAGLTIRHDRASNRLVISPAGSGRMPAMELTKLLNRIACEGVPPL